MHAASEELRAWTLQELERLRAYARSTVDELGEELRDARDRASRAEARVAALEASLKDASVGLAEAERSAAASAAESDRRAEAARAGDCARASSGGASGVRSRSGARRRGTTPRGAGGRRARGAYSRAPSGGSRRTSRGGRSTRGGCGSGLRGRRARSRRRGAAVAPPRRRAGFVAWRDLAVERCAGSVPRTAPASSRWTGSWRLSAGGGAAPRSRARSRRCARRRRAPRRTRLLATAGARFAHRHLASGFERWRRAARDAAESARSPGAPRGAVAPRARAGRDGVVARVA